MNLLPVTLVDGEELMAYVDRLWERNGLWGLNRHHVHRNYPRLWAEIEAAAPTHSSSDCPTCTSSLQRRWSCPKCLPDQRTPLQPDYTNLICRTHLLWLPTSGGEIREGKPATHSETRSQERLVALRQAGLQACTWWLARSLSTALSGIDNLHTHVYTAGYLMGLSDGSGHISPLALNFLEFQGKFSPTGHLGHVVRSRGPRGSKSTSLWDEAVNGPRTKTVSRNKRVSWLCPKEHSFLASTTRIETHGATCPTCARGENSNPYPLLGELGYEIDLARWHQEGMLSPHSRKQVPWHCPEGHRYTSTPMYRSQGRGCPVCAGFRLWSGYNDLLTVNPSLALEWDMQANGNTAPSEAMSGEKKERRWICRAGHRFTTTTTSRRKQNGCPICSGTVVNSQNCLSSLRPILARQLVESKEAREVTSSARAVLTWICPLGHHYKLRVAARTGADIGCRHCAGRH